MTNGRSDLDRPAVLGDEEDHADDLSENDPEDDAGNDNTHDDVDFDTMMDEEGEDEQERPGWARRRWSSAALVVAALVGAVLVALATWTWPDSGAEGDLVAEVELVSLASHVGSAMATVRDVDGRQLLQIEARELSDAADGYAQVWLLDPQLDRFLPIGTLDAESTELWLPSTLDLAAYPIVEVSQETFDGDPGHSGRTLWRGSLPVGG